MTEDEIAELKRRLLDEGPLYGTRISFFDGMTKEQFEEYERDGYLPLGIGTYEEVQEKVRIWKLGK